MHALQRTVGDGEARYIQAVGEPFVPPYWPAPGASAATAPYKQHRTQYANKLIHRVETSLTNNSCYMRLAQSGRVIASQPLIASWCQVRQVGCAAQCCAVCGVAAAASSSLGPMHAADRPAAQKGQTQLARSISAAGSMGICELWHCRPSTCDKAQQEREQVEKTGWVPPQHSGGGKRSSRRGAAAAAATGAPAAAAQQQQH